jgi:dTDP-4-dehydrorhamnose reductase
LECDITQPFDIDAVLRHHKPDVVINCAGIVTQSPNANDVMNLFKVNAQGPKLLQAACDEVDCRLIQISTDCVYSGTRGNYCEIDIPNPTTLYGMSNI